MPVGRPQRPVARLGLRRQDRAHLGDQHHALRLCLPASITALPSQRSWQVFEAGASVNSLQWNPNQALTLLAVAYSTK